MAISRRRILGLIPVLAAGLISATRGQDRNDNSRRVVFGHQLHDDVSVSLLDCYARSLALEDKDARWEAQMLFHEAQLARTRGGAMAMKLGSNQEAFLKAHELGKLPVKLHRP